MRSAARRVLVAAAFDLAGRAAADAPIETGRLRGSVSPGGDPQYGGDPGPAVVVEEGDRMEVSVTFSTPYAAAQHEGHATMHRGDTVYEWRARNWPLGGGPKFLERNLTAMAPRYEAALAAAVAAEMEKA
jgi:hypothetical protein